MWARKYFVHIIDRVMLQSGESDGYRSGTE